MVPDGFKFYRHIGLVPADWEVWSANDVCLKITDGTHDTPAPIKSGVPYIKSVHIKRGRVEFEKCLFLDKQDHDVIYRRCNPQKGDLLIVNIGAGNIGDYAYVDVEFEFSMKNIALLKPNPCLVNSQYLFQYYQSIKSKVVRSTKTGGAQPFLSLRDLKQIKIVTPSLAEQKKIARIFATWDQAIEVTEKLIRNSQQQKISLMQQLLTGKKRLSGFSGEWKECKVYEIGKVVTGNTPPKSEDSNYGGDIFWATAEDFKQKYIQSTRVKLTEDGAKKARVVPAGSVLVTCIASIGKNAIAGNAMATNQQINAVIVNKNNCNEYFYYTVEYYNNKLLAWAGVTAVPILNKASFEKIGFLMPKLEEQQKIASVLSAADKEIETLQQKLDFLKQEKKALMQQLLTGKRRVKIDEDDMPQKETVGA